MHTLTFHDMTRARLLLRQFNLLLLALLAGLVVGRSLPTDDNGLPLSTQISHDVDDAEVDRTSHPGPIPDRIAAHGQLNCASISVDQAYEWWINPGCHSSTHKPGCGGGPWRRCEFR